MVTSLWLPLYLLTTVQIDIHIHLWIVHIHLWVEPVVRLW